MYVFKDLELTDGEYGRLINGLTEQAEKYEEYVKKGYDWSAKLDDCKSLLTKLEKLYRYKADGEECY